MPRQRYRLFMILAAIIVILLYRALQDPEPLRPAAVVGPQPPPQSPPSPPSPSSPPRSVPQEPGSGDNAILQEKLSLFGGRRNTRTMDHDAQLQLRPPSGVNRPQADSDSDSASTSDDLPKPQGHIAGELSTRTTYITTTATTATAATTATTSSEFAKPTKVHWTKPKEHFPLPKESIITLPTGTAKKIPRIQHVFPPEADGPKKRRLLRQAKVREEIQRSWEGYRKHAWLHDELLPTTNRSRDPFCGWSATLVDSLDTLWIAGLKDEFDEAAKAAQDIDFTYTDRAAIPVFETTIRYLGGLIAAYDVSGGASGAYSFLLDKAVELADILMGIFDTPNRMPLLYYYWRPVHASQPRRASSAAMAELATLSMEFTRLAQLTAQHKYYDAIDRITNGLVDLQKRGTTLPGLFPQDLEISGCNRTTTRRQNVMSKAAKAQVDSEIAVKPPQGYGEEEVDTESTGTRDRTKTKLDDRLERRAPPSFQDDPDVALSATKPRTAKSQPKSQSPIGADGNDWEWDCAPQGFVPEGYSYESYHMGGGQDSAYEYFGKEYLLLGGKEPKYQKLYEDATDSINKYLLFRPMVKGNWDIMFPAKVKLNIDGSSPKVDYEVTHLTCFIGGMYALGGRLFGREKDVEYAKKFTDGCVWAYQSTATGIMPEHGLVVPCPTMDVCSFNASLWRQELNLIYPQRNEEVRDWEKNALEREKFSKQDHEWQVVPMKKGAKTEPLGVVGEEDGDAGFQIEAATSDELSGFDMKQPSVKIPTLKDEYHSRPEVPSIPDNRAGHSGRPSKRATVKDSVQETMPEGIPAGYKSVSSTKYILRPEAIESVWYMYRITGDPSWMDKGWTMFEATIKATRAPQANSAIANVLRNGPILLNEMESFWLAETLKYYYLLFSEPDVISLDEWVLNTEAHPFKL